MTRGLKFNFALPVGYLLSRRALLRSLQNLSFFDRGPPFICRYDIKLVMGHV